MKMDIKLCNNNLNNSSCRKKINKMNSHFNFYKNNLFPSNSCNLKCQCFNKLNKNNNNHN